MDLKSGALNQPQGQGQTSAEVAAMAERMTPLVMTVAAKEGQVIAIPASDKRDIILNLEPAADLNMITVQLPQSSAEGQRCFIGTTRQIMTCQLTAGSTPVNNAVLMFSAGDNAAFIRNKSNTWSRVLTS